MKFRAVLELNGKTATGIPVPDQIVTGLAGGKRPKVQVTINGFSYRSSVGSRGGRAMLPVSAQIRDGAGIAAGDEVEVDLELDTAVREVSVLPGVATALAGTPAAQSARSRSCPTATSRAGSPRWRTRKPRRPASGASTRWSLPSARTEGARGGGLPIQSQKDPAGGARRPGDNSSDYFM